MSNSTKFRIRKSHNREYYWTLQATNGEIILTSSETYKTKQALLRRSGYAKASL